MDDPVVGDLIVLLKFLVWVFTQFLLYSLGTVACIFNYHILDFDVSSLRNQIVYGNVNSINPFSFRTLRGSILLYRNCLICSSCIIKAVLDAVLLLELIVCSRITSKFGAIIELKSHT